MHPIVRKLHLFLPLEPSVLSEFFYCLFLWTYHQNVQSQHFFVHPLRLQHSWQPVSRAILNVCKAVFYFDEYITKLYSVNKNGERRCM